MVCRLEQDFAPQHAAPLDDAGNLLERRALREVGDPRREAFDIDVVVEEPDAPGERATVEVRLFLGAITRLELVTARPHASAGGATRLSADLPTRDARALDVGTAVSFSIDPALVRVFDIESEA